MAYLGFAIPTIDLLDGQVQANYPYPIIFSNTEYFIIKINEQQNLTGKWDSTKCAYMKGKGNWIKLDNVIVSIN